LTDLTSQIKEKAGLATSQFQGRARGALDYSEKRLEIIEEMLEEASKFVEQMPPKDSQSLIELIELPTKFQTPRLGAMMISEVWDGKAKFHSGVQARGS
jgi:hypothetical protein